MIERCDDTACEARCTDGVEFLSQKLDALRRTDPIEALAESIATTKARPSPPYYVIKWGDEYVERAVEQGRLALTRKQRKARRFAEEPDAWQWLGKWNPECIPLDGVRTVRIVRTK